ncbi:MAG: hypothetical protein ACRDQY_14210 [Pseudonocardiaceae bacterium]
MTPGLTVRDLNDWATMQSERLRLALDSDAGSHPAFVLAQAVKLAEEVGELQAEVLGLAGYQRATKGQRFASPHGGVAELDTHHGPPSAWDQRDDFLSYGARPISGGGGARTRAGGHRRHTRPARGN